jgi:methionine-rich copper-binding protein CopC
VLLQTWKGFHTQAHAEVTSRKVEERRTPRYAVSLFFFAFAAEEGEADFWLAAIRTKSTKENGTHSNRQTNEQENQHRMQTSA